ncbi:hypothetical protein CRUP_032305 [Coryphaenoides rupestris]|nr:hypothetical protein CRUP_032305 [Coryphaenoides rupestris]
MPELQVNSFEQLCINYANESLQYYFCRVVFSRRGGGGGGRRRSWWWEEEEVDEEEYMREQIEWQQQTFAHNQDCLDLIGAKPHGILRILDDQSGFPQVQKFLDKNFDSVRQDVLDLFIQSKNREPGVFDMELMSTQLRYSGILETIHIRKLGYPIRMHFHTFLFRDPDFEDELKAGKAPPAHPRRLIVM